MHAGPMALICLDSLLSEVASNKEIVPVSWCKCRLWLSREGF